MRPLGWIGFGTSFFQQHPIARVLHRALHGTVIGLTALHFFRPLSSEFSAFLAFQVISFVPMVVILMVGVTASKSIQRLLRRRKRHVAQFHIFSIPALFFGVVIMGVPAAVMVYVYARLGLHWFGPWYLLVAAMHTVSALVMRRPTSIIGDLVLSFLLLGLAFTVGHVVTSLLGEVGFLSQQLQDLHSIRIHLDEKQQTFFLGASLFVVGLSIVNVLEWPTPDMESLLIEAAVRE